LKCSNAASTTVAFPPQRDSDRRDAARFYPAFGDAGGPGSNHGCAWRTEESNLATCSVLVQARFIRTGTAVRIVELHFVIFPPADAAAISRSSVFGAWPLKRHLLPDLKRNASVRLVRRVDRRRV